MGRKPQSDIRILLSVVFVAMLGQMMLNPIIAPLARSLGLQEWQLGVTISTAAIMLVLTSRRWGRLSQSQGRKRVLVAALGLAVISLALFALLAWAGLSKTIVGVPLFLLFLLCRGVGFGIAITAILPTAQAYIADITTTEHERVKGLAQIGAIQGISMVAGSVLGGILAFWGLMTPLIAVPILLTCALVLTATRLRKEDRHELITDPRPVRVLDPRVWPFLLAGFGLLTALGFIQVITGFLVQDRLGLIADMTGVVSGAALLAAGIGMIAAQAIIVPVTKWDPTTLLRVGSLIALVGFLALSVDLGITSILIGVLAIGLGIGLAMPGYSAGPSLFMHRDEQGGLAGLIGAMSGLSFVIAPTAGTALYGVNPLMPILVGAVMSALVLVFVLVHPRFRLAAQWSTNASTPDSATTTAADPSVPS